MPDAADIVAPDWVSPDARVTRLVGTSITLESKGNATLVFPGRVPAGWTVTVKDRGILAEIQATKVSKTAKLILAGSFTQSIAINAPFLTLELDSDVRLDGQIRLSTDDVTIISGGPARTIDLRPLVADAELGYRFQRRPDPGSGRVTLAGKLTLREISGTDLDLQVSGPQQNGAGQDHLHPLIGTSATGQVRFSKELRHVAIDAPGVNIVAAALFGGEITARSLIINGQVEASTLTSNRFEAAGVSGSTVLVNSEEPGPSLVVGGLRDRRESEPIALNFNAADGSVHEPNALGVHGAANGSTLTSRGPGDIHLGSAEQTLLSSAGGIAVYKSYNTGRQVDRPVAIHADGDVFVGEHLVLASGDELSARQIYVRGKSTGGRIAATNVIVNGDVTEIFAEATEFRAGGNLTRTSLGADKVVLQPNATVDPESRVLVRGTGTSLPKGFTGELRWEGRGELTLAGVPTRIEVTAPEGSQANLKVANPELVIPEVIVRRSATFHTEGKGEGAVVISKLVLDDSAGPSTAAFSGAGVTLAAVADSPGAVIEHRGGHPMRVNLEGCRHLTLSPAARAEIKASATEDVSVAIAGKGLIEFSGTVAAVRGPEVDRSTEPADVPTLAVTANGSVQHLTGGVRLGVVQGRITGQAASRQGWRRMWPWAPLERCSPLVFDLVHQPGREDEGGYVIDVDPTPTSFHRLLNVEGFHVFEPSAPALIEWSRSVGRKGTPDEKRDAAYKAKRIADQVKKTAASGSARATANWAAAHTHHRALRHAPIENIFRWFHRALGYSYRPGPALFFYLAVVLPTAALTWKARLASGTWQDIGGAGAILLRVATLPVSWLLKLPTEDDKLLFTTDWMNPVVFFLAGFPLVFFVVALRHFLSPPSD